MTAVALSDATRSLVDIARTQGAGAGNINYLNAYNAVYHDLQANGNVNSGTVYWFSQAGAINANTGTLSADFIRSYTMASAASQGVFLTEAQLQQASDGIAAGVFNKIYDANYQIDDSINAQNSFSTKSIIALDAMPAIEVLQSFAPAGITLSPATWGGTLFASTSLNDPTFVSDIHLNLSPNSADCKAIFAGFAAGASASLFDAVIYGWFGSNYGPALDMIGAVGKLDLNILDKCLPSPSDTPALVPYDGMVAQRNLDSLSLVFGNSTEQGQLKFVFDKDSGDLLAISNEKANAKNITILDGAHQVKGTVKENSDGSAVTKVYDPQTHALAAVKTLNTDGTSVTQFYDPVSHAWLGYRMTDSHGNVTAKGTAADVQQAQFTNIAINTLADQVITQFLIKNNLPLSLAAEAFAHATIDLVHPANPTQMQDFTTDFVGTLTTMAGGILGADAGADIFNSIGLPPELGSLVGSTIGGAAAQQLASVIAADVIGVNPEIVLSEIGPNILDGMTMAQFGSQLAGAFETAGFALAGSTLEEALFENRVGPGAQIGGALGASIGAWFGGPIGAFVGDFIGELFGGLFGGHPSVGPNASSVSQYNPTTNQFEFKWDTHDNGGDPAQVNAMSAAMRDLMNGTLTSIGGHATSFVQDMSLIWFQNQYYFDFNDHYGEPYQDVFDNPDDAVRAATFQWLRGLRIDGGDPYMEYMLRHSDATNLQGLLNDLAAARDYSLSISDPVSFDVALALSTPEQYQMWQAELARAQQLGLDKLTTAELDALKQYGNLTSDDLPHYGTVIGAANNFLGVQGKTYFVKDASNAVSAWQFDDRAGVLTKVTALQNPDGTPLNISNGAVVLASNHMANGGYQLILEDHSANSNTNQPLKIQTFDAQGKATGAATALTYVDGSAFSYAQAQIPDFGSDAYWSMWQSSLRQIGYAGPFDGVTPMSWYQSTFGVALDNHSAAGMQQLLDHLHSVPSALANGHVVGTANNLLGAGGFDLIAADSAGHVRIHEFNAQGQAVQELSLNSTNGSPFTLPMNGLPANLWQSMPTYNTDDFWAVWQPMMRQLGYTGPFDSKEPTAWYAEKYGAYLDENSAASMWQLYDKLAYPDGPQLIGTTHNLTGSSTYELIVRAPDGTVSIDAFNPQGQALSHRVLTNADGSTHFYEAGSKFLGTSHNLLGSGGYDLVFETPDGQDVVDEYNAQGQLGLSQPLTAGQQFTAFALNVSQAPSAPPPPNPVLVSDTVVTLTSDTTVLGNNDTVTAVDHLKVGLLGSNNTITLGADDTLTVYRGASNVVNASNDSIQTGANVGLTINGGGNDITADDGASLTVKGNGVFGATNTINLSNGTVNLIDDARADLTGVGNSVHAGQYDTLTLAGGSGNNVSIGDNGYVAITDSYGNEVSAGQNASIGVTNGNDNVLTLGTNATAWLTDTIGDTVNASGASIYAYQNVQFTLNGGNNHVSAASGDVVTIEGNGLYGPSNFVTMSNGTLNIASDASATLTGDGNTVSGGDADLLSIDHGNNNAGSLGDNGGAAINHGDGNTLRFGQNAMVGVTDGNNETLTLGSNANVWLTRTTGTTINASTALVYAYDSVNVTINGSGNTIGALDGDTVTVGGNGQWGSANLVYLSNGTLNLTHDADASITGNYNAVHADQTDLVTINGNGNALQFGSNGLAWVQSGYGNVIKGSGAGVLIGDNVANTSIIGDGNTIYTGANDNLNISGADDTIHSSGSTIYLNADALNTNILGDNDIIHVRAGSVYQVVGSNNTIVIDTVVNAHNGDTLPSYDGVSDLIDIANVPFDASMIATATLNPAHTAGDLVLSSHGAPVATIHLASAQNVGSFTVRSDGAGGTLIVDPPVEGNEDVPTTPSASHGGNPLDSLAGQLGRDDGFHFDFAALREAASNLLNRVASKVGITESGQFDFSTLAETTVLHNMPLLNEAGPSGQFVHSVLPQVDPTVHDGFVGETQFDPHRPGELPHVPVIPQVHHDLL